MRYMEYIKQNKKNRDIFLDKRVIWLLLTIFTSLLAFQFIYGEEWSGYLFWLSFPLTSLVTFGVLFYRGYSGAASFLSSILYTFLPWKYFESFSIENNHHYFAIPLIVMMCWDVALGKTQNWHLRYWGECCIILIWVSNVQSDLAHAGIIVLLVSIFYGIYNHRSRKDGFKLAVIGILIPLCLLLRFLYKWHMGTVVEYTAQEILANSIGLFDLLIPILGHRIFAVEPLYIGYTNPALSMGTLLSFGFLMLLVVTITKKYDEHMHCICLLNIILLTISHRYCINVFIRQVYPYFKNYKVFYLFISFFACIMIAECVDKVAKFINNKHIIAIGVLILTVLSLMDMSSGSWRSNRLEEGTVAYRSVCIEIENQKLGILDNARI